MKKGLALAGGGVKGSYQVGAYMAFKKMHIKFDGIVGTSIGALNGAILLSGKYKELLKLWQTIDPATLMEVDPEVAKAINDGKVNINTILGALRTGRDALKNKGLPLNNIRILTEPLVDIQKIKNSKKDYGLTTINYSKLKPVYKYKEDISDEQFMDYIMASCSLPVFQLNRNIDNDIYIDGGFYDNCPTNMLVNKGYDLIYEVKINGVGLLQKIKNKDVKVVTISPSRDNGTVLDINHDRLVDNIYMGYYDTLKKLGKYDGYKYTFKKIRFLNIKKIDNIDKFSVTRVKNFFNEYDLKKLLIKSLEYVMEKEGYDYNKVYNFKKVIKNIKSKDNFVYKFIKKYQNL